jgi:hypothetical protein
MNTDKTNGFPSLSLIRDNPCYPWSKKPGHYFEQKEMKGAKKAIIWKCGSPLF